MNKMVCFIRLCIFVILSTQAYLACATNTTTLQLLVMLNLKTHQEDSAWTEDLNSLDSDGTEDLNSFQLHRWQWTESTRTSPSYLGTTWS